jgi:soluble lytic murein transglycosylase-like protein
MKRHFLPIANNANFKDENSYSQKNTYWPVDKWDDLIDKKLLELADEYRILLTPSMGQHVAGVKASGSWCGKTSASMVHNFWQLCQNPDCPEDYYIRMSNDDGRNLHDADGDVVPSANLTTINKAAKKLGYLDASFGAISMMTLKSESWVQTQCKSIVDSIEFKCPVVLYSRFSVTKAHQHIIVVSGYAKFAGELWLLFLDPEWLTDTSGRVLERMYSIAPKKPAATQADLKSVNSKYNVIRFHPGDWDHSLGAIYFLKASHLFAAHCKDAGKYNYQNKDAGSVGRYLHHGHKAPTVSVPDELVWTSGQPKVTTPTASWWQAILPPLASSFHAVVQTTNTAAKVATAVASPGVAIAQLLVKAAANTDKIRTFVEEHLPESVADALSSRSSLQPFQGYFPIGMGGSWHGGIHCAAESDGSIHLYRDGVIVAARLPWSDPTKPKHGSRNFVLVRHETAEENPYWSLYMHLKPIPLSEASPNLQLAMPWLYRMTLTKIGDKGTVMRSSPGKSGPELRKVSLNEMFAVLDSKVVENRTWYHVRSPQDGKEGWIGKTEQVECKMGIPELQQFKEGKVVKLERPARYATCLGFVDPETKSGEVRYFHWEIFSKDPLPGNWQEVCDKETYDQQWIGDPDQFKKILGRNQMGSFTEPLTPANIVKIYEDEKSAKLLRACACKFVSEWAIDWTKAVEGKGMEAQKETIVKEFQPYSFWKDAIAAGVDLPSDGKVWHYNPKEALNRLHPVVAAPKDKTLPEQAEALKTKWTDPDGNPYTNENTYNVWIQLAAMNHGVPALLLKSLIAQESKFKANASNSGGYAGLTQLGLDEAKGVGLDTGTTAYSGDAWKFDPQDARFDPAKSVDGGAAYYASGAEMREKLVFKHFEEEVVGSQHEKFALAVYNCGIGTVSGAWKAAHEAGKDDATWEDLTEGETESYLCQAMPKKWDKSKKYKEITNYVVQILSRLQVG